jgi:FkbM family methyltransferase
MQIGVTIETALHQWRKWRRDRAPGPIGDFYRAGGNNALYENLPIKSDDLVLDVGGYRGEWTAEIAWRYGCRSIILEAIPSFAHQCTSRFRSNARVVVIGEALGAESGTTTMTEAADSSSALRPDSTAPRLDVKVLGVNDLFAKRELTEVACMKINIEGGEYELLERMQAAGLLSKVRCFLIQFHTVASDSGARRSSIAGALSQTHKKVFDYPFVWERWDRA